MFLAAFLLLIFSIFCSIFNYPVPFNSCKKFDIITLSSVRLHKKFQDLHWFLCSWFYDTFPWSNNKAKLNRVFVHLRTDGRRPIGYKLAEMCPSSSESNAVPSTCNVPVLCAMMDGKSCVSIMDKHITLERAWRRFTALGKWVFVRLYICGWCLHRGRSAV